MSLGVRQQGELAYLRGALGLDTLEERVSKLEGQSKEDREELLLPTLEQAHDRGLAAMAELPASPVQPYSPEGSDDPDPDSPEGERAAEWKPLGEIDHGETVQESNAAVEDDQDLESLLQQSEDLRSDDDYDDWTVNELKAKLAERGQPVSGNKQELIERVRQGDEEESRQADLEESDEEDVR